MARAGARGLKGPSAGPARLLTQANNCKSPAAVTPGAAQSGWTSVSSLNFASVGDDSEVVLKGAFVRGAPEGCGAGIRPGLELNWAEGREDGEGDTAGCSRMAGSTIKA